MTPTTPPPTAMPLPPIARRSSRFPLSPPPRFRNLTMPQGMPGAAPATRRGGRRPTAAGRRPRRAAPTARRRRGTRRSATASSASGTVVADARTPIPSATTLPGHPADRDAERDAEDEADGHERPRLRRERAEDVARRRTRATARSRGRGGGAARWWRARGRPRPGRAGRGTRRATRGRNCTPCRLATSGGGVGKAYTDSESGSTAAHASAASSSSMPSAKRDHDLVEALALRDGGRGRRASARRPR